MPRSLSRALLLLTLICATPCPASQTIVPDQSATIQIGIDSGVDTVLIRPGSYAEVPVANRGVVIRGVLPSQPFVGFTVFELPAMGGFIGHPNDGGTIQLIDVRVQGTTVITPTNSEINLARGCRFDAGLSVNGAGNVYVQNCMVFGNCIINGMRSDVGRNTIIGGTLKVSASATTIVHDNVIVGPAPLGIDGGSDVQLRDNYVRACVDGIRVSCDQNAGLSGNIVEDCSGTGYIRPCNPSQQTSFNLVSGNVARRCGGRGFDLKGHSRLMTGNVVEDAGAEGIFMTGTLDSLTNNIVLRTGGAGISTSNVFYGVRGNQVLSAQGDGMLIGGGSDDVSRNVVGRCGGRGIVVSRELVHYRVRNNTTYLNAGAGLALTSTFAAPDSVSHNIGYGNANGLVWAGTSTPALGCNDWYLNTGAAVVGTPVGTSDVAIDPKFCDLPADIVSLADSPLANLPGCGLVGALPQTCTVAVGVSASPGGPAMGLRVEPQPAGGRVRFAWEPGPEPGRIEIYDVGGARRFSRGLPAGSSEFVWAGVDDSGTPVPAGIYFARRSAGAVGSQTRVVIVR